MFVRKAQSSASEEPVVSEPSPQDELARLMSGYWHTQAIHVAAKVGLADLLKDGPRAAEQLAARPGRTPARCTACCGRWPAWASSPRTILAGSP
jgi:hypothetical protein